MTDTKPLIAVVQAKRSVNDAHLKALGLAAHLSNAQRGTSPLDPVAVEAWATAISGLTSRALAALDGALLDSSSTAELQRRLDLVRDYAAFNRKYGGDETARADVAWMLARIVSGECQQIGADR